MGGLGGYVIFLSPIAPPCQLTILVPQNIVPKREAPMGSGSIEAVLTEVLATNQLLRERVSNLEKQLAGAPR